MDFYKRVLILSSVDNKSYSGVIKLNSICDGVEIIYNIVAPENNDYLLLLKENDNLYTAHITSGKGAVEIKGMKNNNVVLCNLLLNDSVVMYGATNGNKIAAFAIINEYKKISTKESTPLKVTVKNKKNIKANSVEKDKTKEEKEKLSLKKETIKKENEEEKEENKKEKIINNEVEQKPIKIPSEDEIINGEKTIIKEEQESIKIPNEDEIINGEDKKLKENKKFSLENIESFYKDNNTIEELFDENLVYKGENFYQSVHNQLDEMFICYPEEKNLKEIMPNSKWIRVDYEKDEYYVVGLISENDNVKYICYGIPSKYSIKPPKEVQNIAEWLPLDINKPRDVGYWIIFQDGITGKTLIRE